MKKKLCLAILPAALMLSACSGITQNLENERKDAFTEDTLAHEELFGGNAHAFDLGQQKGLQPRKSIMEQRFEDPDPLTQPTIGVQYAVEPDGDYAIRYVAAIASLRVQATWTRDIAEVNGGRTKDGQSLQFPVNKAYDALSEAGEDGNEAPLLPSSVGSEYRYFVVYTLRNIPEDKVNSYLFGYLTLTSLEGEGSVSTQARVSRVGGGNTYKFDIASSDYHGYFIKGSIGGSSNPIKLDGTPSEGNYAQKENLSLSANDTFGIFKYQQASDSNHTGEHFQFFGYEQLRRSAQFFSRVSEKDYYKVPGTGTYKLYLTTSHEVHIITPDAGKTSAKFYFKTGLSWGTSARYALNAFNNNANPATQCWITLSRIDDTDYYTCNAFSAVEWPEIQLVRLNPGTSTYNWDGDWWSKTGNLSTDSAGNIFYVNDDATTNRDQDAPGNWNLYLPA